MKTNIFLNSYQQPENKLTYSFLSVVELINSRRFCETLTGVDLAEEPVLSIQTVYGGKETNPDGGFELRRRNGKSFTVYFENKTKRRDLSADQLLGHLKLLQEGDMLLIITPRRSDNELIKGLNNPSIRFCTWGEITQALNRENNPIIKQFIEYGELSGEFEELRELDKSDIEACCKFFQAGFLKKLKNILDHFAPELNMDTFGFCMTKLVRNDWGRYGVELRADASRVGKTSYGQFGAISYYHDSTDHGIPFKLEQPEICLFLDVDPSQKERLRRDDDFVSILEELKKLGFENNLYGNITNNQWRLLFYRRPISDFTEISVLTLLQFADDVFGKLLSVNLSHPYFEELKVQPATASLALPKTVGTKTAQQ